MWRVCKAPEKTSSCKGYIFIALFLALLHQAILSPNIVSILDVNSTLGPLIYYCVHHIPDWNRIRQPARVILDRPSEKAMSAEMDSERAQQDVFPLILVSNRISIKIKN